MDFREATIKDIESVAKRSISRGCRELPQNIDYVYALEHDGVVLGVGGVKLLNATTAWAWMDWTKEALRFKTWSYRTVKEWLDILIQQRGFRRLMAAVATDFPQAIDTVEHLGFHRESLMPGFYGDESAYLYVRLEGGD